MEKDEKIAEQGSGLGESPVSSPSAGMAEEVPAVVGQEGPERNGPPLGGGCSWAQMRRAAAVAARGFR